MSRPSGIPVITDDSAPVVEDLAHIEARGRLNLLPRWRKRVVWLASAGDTDVESLLVFKEPGMLSIHDWKLFGPKIQQRYREFSTAEDEDNLRALALIQTRYRRLVIPSRDRPSLGDAALAHLGLPLERGSKHLIYVLVQTDRIDLLSPQYRNEMLAAGDPRLEDLP